MTKTKGEAERLIKMIDKQLLASDYFYCFVGRVGFSCGGISLPGDSWTGKCHSAKAIISSAKVSHRVLSQANFFKAIVAKPTNVLATLASKKAQLLDAVFWHSEVGRYQSLITYIYFLFSKEKIILLLWSHQCSIRTIVMATRYLELPSSDPSLSRF